MRICLLTYRGNPYCGGQGIYIRYVAEELARQGHRVTVIAGDPQPGSINGVLVHRIPNRNHFNNRDRFIDPERPFAALSPLDIYEFVMSRMGIFAEMETFSVRALPLVRKLHREEPFDIIHDNQCLGYGFLLFRQLGVPVISTIHHPLSIDRNIWFEQSSNFRTKMKRVLYYPLPMQKMVANRMDRIITVSRSAAGEITRAFKVPRERISVVYNGMDLSLFKPAGGRQQARSGLIFVGNVEDRKKGVIYLLKALTETKHPVRLTIVDGGTPARSLIPRLIDRFGLNHRVIFTGKIPLDELLRLYGTHRLAVMPSLYEGFGFPAAEAMACGLPVIAARGGALPEVVGEHRDTAWLVPPRDFRELARGIDYLLDHPAETAAMARRGMYRIRRLFTWKQAVTEMAGIYRDVIDAYR